MPTEKREHNESIFDFWNKLAKLATECKLDNKTATEIVNALIVAVFTIAVGDEEIVITVWEKTMSHDQLSEHIAKLHQTNQNLQKVIPDRPNSKDVKVKQEPIGRIKDRKYDKRREKVEKKEGFKKGVCIRCGDKWTKSHMEKCPAKNKKCNICKKEGYVAKVCKSDQKKTQTTQEEDSSDSQESDSEQSESEDETSSIPENSTSSDSFEEKNEKHRKRTQSENVKRKTRISRLRERGLTESRELIPKLTVVKPKSNDTIELKMSLASNLTN